VKQIKPNGPFKYYFIGARVAITIGVFIFLGYQIDMFLSSTHYYTTICLSVASIIYSLWSLVKDINHEK
tara:strand:+ start:2894 stop:3100 length:207 start_codon:yes stop_codon:yes gene_type:complete